MGKSDFNEAQVIELTSELGMEASRLPNLAPWEQAEFLENYGRIWNELCLEKSRLMPDAKLSLRRLLRSGYLLGLVTGRRLPFADTRTQLERLSIWNLFRAIVPRDSVGEGKPSPKQLLLASKLLGCEPNKCIAVGDVPLDVRAARNAGMQSIAVRTGIFPESVLEKESPDLILPNVKDVALLVLEIPRSC